MAGNKSVVRFMSSGYPLEVNTKMQKLEDEDGTTEFTYSLGNTHVTMKITEKICSSGGVKQVYIDLFENSGKGSFANLNLRLSENKRYGILCNFMNTTFGGSYNSIKNHYYAPPLPEREVVRYYSLESGCGGCFTLEKKKHEYGVVVRVKATHDFIVGEETMHVKVKIGYDDGGREKGLNVEVDGPVKLTTEYVNYVVSRSERKMWTAIEASNDAVETGRKGITMAVRNPTLKQKENSIALQNDITY
ncbi:hypothetical protein PHAVU_009G256000 [Phaseolus vulgaris]|uniref:Uncharacterized protein n=1 Tax=Phaseolus vulgaris TaxID=3885 RepID=V7B0A6_PHAVU|nr:hypothetical protein PHAVU_009G256000g [Phaseolus vulgaris]ESW10990.1 hypothetical protein PHAVU_009G256000g [Phaseolus vulgaris]